MISKYLNNIYLIFIFILGYNRQFLIKLFFFLFLSLFFDNLHLPIQFWFCSLTWDWTLSALIVRIKMTTATSSRGIRTVSSWYECVYAFCYHHYCCCWFLPLFTWVGFLHRETKLSHFSSPPQAWTSTFLHLYKYLPFSFVQVVKKY